MRSIKDSINRIIDFLVSSNSKKYSLANKIWLIILFLSGTIIWINFLRCPEGACYFQDWPGVTIARFTFLKEAASQGVLPLHSSTPLRLGDFTTDRYMAIPDAFLSPQYLLLRFLNLRQFIYSQIVLFFTAGFLGLLWFRRKFNLSILNFTFIFILFNFNGDILAHISVGYFTWLPYFLFPWFVILFFKLVDGQDDWIWITSMTSLLFIVLLQGGYHQFIWMLFFIGFTAVSMPRHFFTLLKAAVFSILVSMFRFLPIFSLYNVIRGNKFIAGYPDIQSFLYNLVTIRQAGIEESVNNTATTIGLWETTFFLGIIGTAFLIYFGLIYPIRHPDHNNPYRILLFPSLGLIILSFDRIYRFIFTFLPLPLITGERVATRFIGLAFVTILFLAAIEFQHWLNTITSPNFSIFTVIALVILEIKNLAVNLKNWIIPVAFQRFGGVKTYKMEWFITNNYNDQPYISFIKFGLAITITTYIFLSAMIIREKKKYHSPFTHKRILLRQHHLYSNH
jgi:hypothetical protein